MSIINATPLLAAAGGDYQISRSVRLRSSASAYFNRTPASAGNRKTWTWSGWVKRGSLTNFMYLFDGYTDASNYARILFWSDDTLSINSYIAGATSITLNTTQVFRDVSAWYHIVVAIDTTQATSTNRVKIYVNGNQVTAFNTATYPAQNAEGSINAAVPHDLGRASSGIYYLDGYLTEINFIDGQAMTPSSFGETNAITGVWQPKKYAGTYGTNGFYLNFSDPSSTTTIGYDYSGNGNNWTSNNISVTAGVTYDSMLDVPTPYADGGNGRGNYCVLNPLNKLGSPTITNGNLRQAGSSAAYASSTATFELPTSGKWYWEVTLSTLTTSANNQDIDIGKMPFLGDGLSSRSRFGATYSTLIYYYDVPSGSPTTIGVTPTAGDVVRVAYDADTGKVWFGYNNTWIVSGDPSAGSNPIYTYSDKTGLFASLTNYNTTGVSDANFGQRPFTYTPPTGFKALNTQNLPDATIKKGNAYFDAVLYTGNNSTTQSINVGLVPDLVWIKSRTSGSGHHSLIDRVRGDVALNSNQTIAEYGVTAFNMNTDGTIDVPYYASDYSMNTSANSYVAWNWKESASAGFDIVTYTGTGSGNITVNHSLGVTPAMWIIKNRTLGTTDWLIGHKSLSANYYLLFQTNAASNASTPFVSQSSSNIVLSGSQNLAQNYVAYLFAEVAGFSRFGSYTGNGSTDGPFVFCGFRPRFIMTKCSSSTSDWHMTDTSRYPTNSSSSMGYLDANTAAAEGNFNTYDGLSNGFKIRDNGSQVNGSGATYIYMAFAENPFKNSLAR